MRTRLTLIVTVVTLAFSGMASAAPAGGPNASGDTANDYVMVALPSPAAASYVGGIPGLARTKPERGRLDTSSPAYAAYRRHLDNEHANFRASLTRVAPGAEIVREYHNVLNGFAIKLNGNSMAAVSRAQGAAVIDRSWLYQPTMNVSPYLINADDVWTTLGGQASAGAGIKVGVIDTGIDDTHVFFDCKGDITHKVYVSGEGTELFGELLVFDHGTHVAGTIAGCVYTGADAEPIEVSGNLSGVAPGAALYDYNVFPGFGAGFIAFGGSAFSHDIAAAIEDALADGMDVVNMSLGGGVQGPHDFLADASNAAVDGGMVVVVAAGNSGPGDSTVESPGSAANVITAGASTNDHVAGVPVILGGTAYLGASGDFDPYVLDPVLPSEGITLVRWNDGQAGVADKACGDSPDKAVGGHVVLISRGSCTFSTKVRSAQAAGAVGVVVYNSAAGPPTAMGHDGGTFPTIPAVMISKSDGLAVITAGGFPVSADIQGPPVEYTNFFGTDIEENVLAGFSSRGPTPFTYLIKPDVVAPGVNIYSSVFDNQFAFFQGTSMATPHVTGSVALLLDANSDWTPAQVKSALVNTANGGILDGLPSGRAVPLQIGGGLVDLALANVTDTFLYPSSASFGLWNGNRAANTTLTIDVTGDTSCTVSLAGNGGGIVSATYASGTITLTLNGGKADQLGSGDYWGDVIVDCVDDVLHAPWFVRIDRQGKP